MRNKITHRQLGRNTAHRLALFRNMVESLVTHERIRTTLAKAKELRRHADKVVTWAKVGGSTYESKLAGFLRTSESVDKVKTVLKPRYSLREGGYTRVLRCGFRKGDNAAMAILEYVDREGELRPARQVKANLLEDSPPTLTLEERLAQVMRIQADLREAKKAGGAQPPPLTPAFPVPHVAPSQWNESLWAPRSKSARAIIMNGGSMSPLSRKSSKGGAGSPSSSGGGSSKAEAKKEEQELR